MAEASSLWARRAPGGTGFQRVGHAAFQATGRARSPSVPAAASARQPSHQRAIGRARRAPRGGLGEAALPFRSWNFIRLVSLLVLAAVFAILSARAEEQRSFTSPLAPSSETPAAPPAPSAAGTVAYTNSMAVLDDQRKLGNGDRVSFRVVEDRKPPVPLIVTDSGEMEVPLIGRVTARGKTCKQIAFETKRLLEKDYFRSCTVIIGLDSVSSKSRGKIYVMGQVRNQGAQEIPADETFTVSRAILRAGGFADFANKKKVRLVRKKPGGGSETTAIDLVQVLDKGKTEKDPELQPDDLIVVPERLINF